MTSFVVNSSINTSYDAQWTSLNGLSSKLESTTSASSSASSLFVLTGGEEDNIDFNLNNTNLNDVIEESNTFILPWWQQLTWSLVFGGMVLVACGGNLIVIWLVLAHKRMRTVTNYFIVNLSVADIMVSTLNVIFNFVGMLNGHWPFGTVYCKISNFIAMISVSASVLTLMAISIDR